MCAQQDVTAPPPEEGQPVLLRALNHNAVMVLVGKERRILVGKGIGFRKKLGDHINLDQAEQVFVPSGVRQLRQLMDLVGDIPPEVFASARRAVDLAEATRGIRATDTLLIAIADHMNAAINRARGGVELDFPLLWEIEQLYPHETELGDSSIEFLRLETGIEVQHAERTAIAMHFVNAAFARSDMTPTAHMTKSLSAIVDMVSKELELSPTKDATAIARFVTHLRYLYVRQAQGQLHQSPEIPLVQVQLSEPLRNLANAVQTRLETSAPLTGAEVTYLHLHLGRLAQLNRSNTA